VKEKKEKDTQGMIERDIKRKRDRERQTEKER
jgi:hypothetical protein